jgi:hypothetical protein
MAGFVVFDQISLGLDHNSCAFSPNELRADQILAALERISLEKLTCEHTGKLAERSALARHGGTCFRASKFCFAAQ